MEDLRKPQRKRRSAPRVRTGCGTCKIRRLKCDEGRPHCTRCIKSGMGCEGYLTKPARFIAVRPLAVALNPSVSLPLDEQEMRYFQDFVQDRFIDNRTKSVSSPHGFLVTDTFFWVGIVLQESHISACTRHAIVAISALARSLHRFGMQRAPADSVVPNPHHEFSLQQYHKALRNLRSAVLRADESDGPRAALVACLVLALFDLLYGHGAFAAQHMAFGRQLLSHWRKRNQHPGLQLDPLPQSADNISRLFIRLALQSTYLSGNCQPWLYKDLDISELPMGMPTKFNSIDEARYIGHLFVSKAANFRLHTLHLEHTNDPIPPELAAKRYYFLEHLGLFNKAIAHLIQNADAESPHLVHPLARPESLKVFPTAMLMRLTPGWGSPQTACDDLREHFLYVISMSRSVIEFEATYSPDTAVICFEYRILPALFFVACKCREHALRREAIDLMLSTHWREGIWDSFIGGKMATWIMEMEEEGMDEAGFVPEHARCFGETFALDMATRTVEMRCWQNLAEGGCVERKTKIEW